MRRAVVRTIGGVRAGRTLTLGLYNAGGNAEPLLCGVEVMAEESGR